MNKNQTKQIRWLNGEWLCVLDVCWKLFDCQANEMCMQPCLRITICLYVKPHVKHDRMDVNHQGIISMFLLFFRAFSSLLLLCNPYFQIMFFVLGLETGKENMNLFTMSENRQSVSVKQIIIKKKRWKCHRQLWN